MFITQSVIINMVKVGILPIIIIKLFTCKSSIINIEFQSIIIYVRISGYHYACA